jgi:predicted RNA-binding protein (virulence factor B family)
MQVGEFAKLEVVRTRKDGALLEWGQPELLPLPFDEQRGEVARGDHVVVYITRDDRVFDRPMASMRFDEFFSRETDNLSQDQKVNLLVFGQSEMGFDAIIDSKYRGILYHNEVFQDIFYGDSLTGYVKKVREDGKVDLMTQLRGTRGTTDLGSIIMAEIRERGGFLPLTDKSPPDDIYQVFGVSKKKFKMAVGRLYKHRDITLDDDGIRLA